jgi:hypothetical protein
VVFPLSLSRDVLGAPHRNPVETALGTCAVSLDGFADRVYRAEDRE